MWALQPIPMQTYWHIGPHISEFDQKGIIKAEYGSERSIDFPEMSQQSLAKASAGPIWFISASFTWLWQKVRHCLTN